MRRALPWVAIALGAWAILSALLHGRQLEDRDARVDSLRTVALEAATAAMGWETRLVSATDGLERRLQEAVDSSDVLELANAELAREVEELGGELRAVATMYAELAGSIEVHDATVHVSAPGAAPDSVTAAVDDGLLSGRLVYRPPATLAIDPYRVELALALGWIEAPDGRALLTARAANPRVRLSFGDVYYQPPAPVEFCGFGAQLKAGAIGGGAAELLRLLLEGLTP